MLKVDLGLLSRQHRTRIDADVPADDPLWENLPWRFDGPVALRLEVQEAGSDVVARGTVEGEAELLCRRCLKPVRERLDEELVLLWKAGLSEEEAEAAEVYALAPRAQELDLGPAVREHVALAMPQFAICEEACRGLCARCGTNLNEASCDCRDEDIDPRWAALRRAGTE